MTTRNRFYLCIIATVLALIVFIVTNFTGYFSHGKVSDFVQGFSGGIALGALLGVFTFGNKLRQEKQGQTAA